MRDDKGRVLADSELMIEIRLLAAERDHHLSPDMTGSQRLTLASAQSVRAHLRGRPVRSGARQAPAAEAAANGRPAAPAARPPDRDPVTEDGIYLHDGGLYKSLVNVSSGHRFAKKLDPRSGRWDYARGAMGYLRAGEKITREQAAEEGRRISRDPDLALYGRCWHCGRPLSNEESISLGIGPVCLASL